MFKNLVIKNYLKITKLKITKFYIICKVYIQTPHMKLTGSLYVIRFALYAISMLN